jgi:hypothetical protein
MQEKIWCENCNKLVTYKTKNIVDNIEIDSLIVTCKQKVDICNVCGNDDCISIKSLDYDVKKAHRAYMRLLFQLGMFKKFFRRLWFDIIRIPRRLTQRV